MINRETIGRPMEILLVEDNLMDAHITIEALKEGNIKHRLTLMRDGEETVEFLERRGRFMHAPAPDLILLDLNLPKKNGLEVLDDIRADPDLQRIPVVILTGCDAQSTRTQCDDHHVQSYITKPVNLQKFLGVVQELKRDWLRHDVILPVAD